MLAPLLAAVLTQAPATPAPQLAVVVTQRSGMGPERAEVIAERIAEVLIARGVDVSGGPKASAQALAAAGTKNPAECQGKRPCVSGLGRLLKVWGVLGVELGDLDGTLAVHLELVDSDKGERHAQLDLVMPTKKAEAEIAAQVMPLVVPVKEVLTAAAPPAAAPKLEPASAPPSAPEAVAAQADGAPALEEKAAGSPVPMVLAFVGGAGAAAASVAFLLLAGQARSELDMAGFSITRAQAQSIAGRANNDYTFSLGFAIGAAALVVVGLVLGLTR